MNPADRSPSCPIGSARLPGTDHADYAWLLDVTTVGIVVVDGEGRIRLLNAEAARLFGYPSAALVGQPVECLIPERFRSAHEQHRLRYRDKPRPRAMGAGLQLYGMRHDGSEFPMEIGLTPLNTADGFLVATTIIDTSARTRAEQALVQAQKMEAVGQLTGGIAHDFNNLLTVISGNLQILQERLGNDPANRRLADAAADAALHGAELVRSLLAFSRKQVLRPEALSVSDACRNMLPLLERTLGEHISVSLECAPDTWPALADIAHLESALLNLAVNARDAMSQGGRLTIEVTNNVVDAGYALGTPGVAPGDYVMLAVTDNGCGMDHETLARALEPFYTTKAPGRGSGLGLPMVFGFARQSGGYLRLYSELGKGTTVRLFLPRAQDSALTRSEVDQSLAAYAGNECVLVLEDDDAVGGLAAHFLTSLGYRVLRARDGAAALSLARGGHQIDLLFADIVLPGEIDGLEAARRMRSLNPALRVLFTSGYPRELIHRRSHLPDNAVLLQKPYSRDTLVRQLRQLLDTPAANAN